MPLNIAEAIGNYNINGFSVFDFYSEAEAKSVTEYARSWLYEVLSDYLTDERIKPPLEQYHQWFTQLHIAHESLFVAKNRHRAATSDVREMLLNARVREFLALLGIRRFDLWDEGLGWLAYRFIRPGFGDGYSFTRKEWGIAKNVVSFWVPVIGHSSRETLTLVPGSHRNEYEKYLPDGTKFRKDEFRLSPSHADVEKYRPELRATEAIVYHPRTLHCEDVDESHVTRLNLEFRVNPLG